MRDYGTELHGKEYMISNRTGVCVCGAMEEEL